MADIITLSEYRTYDDSPSPAENDSQITAAIGLATSYIETKTGRVFEIADNPSPVEITETLNGLGISRLYTRNSPVTSITLLEYWSGREWIEYELIPYPRTFKSGSNVIYFTQGHKFYQNFQNIRATFEYGYTTALPSDLKMAAYKLTKHIIDESERQGIKRQEDGEQNFWYEHTVPTLVEETIARYRNVY